MRRAVFPTALMYGRRRLTRLEIAIYAGGCAVLLAIFLDKALDYMELAEKATMETTLNVAILAVNTRLVTDMLRSSARVEQSWTGRNPFVISGATPASYSGDIANRDITSLERPCWLFDERSGELVYLPHLRRRLRTVDTTGVLRFRMVSVGPAAGYKLVVTSPFEWKIDP